jgi:hypothetical protein
VQLLIKFIVADITEGLFILFTLVKFLAYMSYGLFCWNLAG